MEQELDLLITGFEPFGGSAVNPSEKVVRALSTKEIPGVKIHTVFLPVDHIRAPMELMESFEKVCPDVLLCLGEARKRAAISIERVAVNLMDFCIPDNLGNQVVDEEIIKGGPAAYFTTLPVRKMLKAIQKAAIPAELSLSAGSYLTQVATKGS